MKAISCMIIIFSVFNTWTLAQQAPRSASVKKRPVMQPYPDHTQKGNQDLWVVYSDRSDNTTYLQPGGLNKLKTLGFMDSFYVIDEQDDFLQLVKYDPTIVGTRIFPRRIKDMKTAVYYGWVEKSKILLSNDAFLDSNTLYPKKYLTILQSPKSIFQCATLLQKDSAKVFSKPIYSAKIKQTVALHQYVYVYKYSLDKRFCLVGKNAQFVPDSASKDMLGWISTSIVQEWGSRLYISPQDEAEKDIQFYTIENERVKDRIVNPTGLAWEDTEPAYPWCSQLPVKGKIQRDQDLFIKTELPVTLYDKRKRTVAAVDGSTITYHDFQNIINKTKIYNVLFVIEGNKRMANFFPYLLNALQATQSSFNEIYPNAHVSYGVVIYTNMNVENCKIRQRVVDALPLTMRYEKVKEYLSSMFSRPLSCDKQDNGTSAMYSGLFQASKLLKGHEEENNIVILVGSVGNDAEEDPSPLIDKITQSNIRLLCFQARNIEFFTANNFVLQSQNIILKSGQQLSDKKRQKLVLAEDVKELSALKCMNSAKNMFFLNYPTASMIQGGIIFPEKGQHMTTKFLKIGVDSLIKQIYVDNIYVAKQLSKVFANVNYRNETFNPLINEDPQLTTDGDCFNSDAFMYTKSVVTSPENKVYKLVLSTDEYNELLQKMQILSGTKYNLQKHAARKKLYNHYIKEIQKAQTGHRELAISNMRLSDALTIITGYPTKHRLLQLYSVTDLKDEKKINKEMFIRLIKYIQSATENMIDNADKNKFLSNGMNYYVLSSQEML